MPFEKGNRHEIKSDRPLGKKPLCIRLDEGVLEELRSVDGWQNDVRDLIKRWVSQGKKK